MEFRGRLTPLQAWQHCPSDEARDNTCRYMPTFLHHRAMVRVLSAAVIVVAGLLIAQRLESREVPVSQTNAGQADPLPSWNDGVAKRSILTFVQSVTNQKGPDYVPPPARIAVFDNDGTLWSERPLYVQLAFALDRVKALAPQHPEWRTTQPFQAVLENDQKALGAAGVKGLAQLVRGDARRDDDRRVRAHPQRLVRDAPGIRASTGPTPRWHSSRWWSSSATSGPTDSRPTSSPAAGSSSCAESPSRCMGSRRSR